MLHGCSTSIREINWNNRLKERTAVKLINRGADIHARTMVSFYSSLPPLDAFTVVVDVISHMLDDVNLL